MFLSYIAKNAITYLGLGSNRVTSYTWKKLSKFLNIACVLPLRQSTSPYNLN